MYASLSWIKGARRLGKSSPSCLNASVSASASFSSSIILRNSSPFGTLNPPTSIAHANRTRSHALSACHVRRNVVPTSRSPRTTSHPPTSDAAAAAAANSAPGGTPSSLAAAARIYAWTIPHTGVPRLHISTIRRGLGGSSVGTSVGRGWMTRRRASQSSRKTTSGRTARTSRTASRALSHETCAVPRRWTSQMPTGVPWMWRTRWFARPSRSSRSSSDEVSCAM
mmetsp:Transcript_11405/g.44332  ORF Transcript_11405/g.44332 Transcript_11405/m.44332 type:complete len:225 (+) Transcript_11405:1747-2421(+)